MNKEMLDKMNELKKLMTQDKDFEQKFSDLFGDMKDNVVLHVAAKDTELTAASKGGGCSCGMYRCGKGCFYGPNMPYPNKGETVG